MFTLLNPDSDFPVLLLCEHAENKIPEELGDLGLSDESILNGHHAFDPPMKKITEGLAEKLGATAIMGNYTRLISDLNRDEDHPDVIVQHYFGYNIPTNIGLSQAEHDARMATYYYPYHSQVKVQIERLKSLGKIPFILSLHSFTESPGENMPERPWDIGLLYNEYETAAHYFADYLAEHHPKFNVGHNVPYDLKAMKTSSVVTHGDNNNLPNLLIELKNEVFDRGEQTHEEWVEIFADILKGFLHLPETERTFKRAVA